MDKQLDDDRKGLPDDVATEFLVHSHEAAIVCNSDGEIVFANRKAEALFGYTADELVGQTIDLLVPDHVRDRHAELRDAYGNAPHARPLLSGIRLTGRRRNGEEFRAEIALLPLKTESGSLVASTIREHDVLSGSEVYFRNLLETAPDAMIIVDDNGTIAVVNSQAERMFGYSRGELLGQSVEMLLPERLRERHRAHRRRYNDEPAIRSMGQGLELPALRRNGDEFPVEISISPVPTEDGHFVSSTIRDVTERYRMERQLIEARQQAERANKANTAFLAAASHDLRQPVQALSLLNGALRRTVKNERALAMIDSQEASLTAMTNLLNSLLDISRLDAGAIAPEFEEFPMKRLVDRLASEFGRQARQKGLDFTATSSPAIVYSDPSLLGEVLQNLVSNAIRYTEEGSVTLSCELDGGICRLSVRDTGVGIAPDELESIFLEFNQGSSTAATKEGFGLGLAIVRRLADLLGVRVSVESTLGEGSCFQLEVPIAIAAQPVEDDERKEERITGSSGLVLLVEDNAIVADAWHLLLEAEGYNVLRATSLADVEALFDSLEECPALLITDYHLAEESTGVEVIQAVREECGAEIPAFIVSGDTSKVVTDARPIDNSVLFRKPINTDELLAAARSAVTSGEVPGI